jgi:large conductance mechanosensitive channel
MIKEFKAFISHGGVFQAAVGLLLALAFKPIVDAVVDLITNVVARVFSAPDFSTLVIKLGGSGNPEPVLKYGVLINAIISFVIVALVLFMLVKAYNKMTGYKEAEAGPTELDVLTEIRDQLASR